jgi:hypothetical protein
MEFNQEIVDRVCVKTNCDFLKRYASGERYCQAYYPDCDEYDLFEKYLAIKDKHLQLRNEVCDITSKLRNKGITTDDA